MPPAVIVHRGLTFVNNVTANAAANNTQLVQSIKESGVMSWMAAVAISPITTGLKL